MQKEVKIYPKKFGQVWIETVIYTLIALVILGAVLSFARPKIQSLQDKSIIEQSIEMLQGIDSTIKEIQTASGNQRQIELGIKKGNLKIDYQNDQIIYEINSSFTYSEPGVMITNGNINITTIKIGKINQVSMVLDYSKKYNLTWNNNEESKTLSASSAQYKILISNKGGESKQINFESI